MNKMTIIQLLNKITNGEEVPKKIKYRNIIWYFNKKDKTYYMNNTEIELFCIEKLTEKLNDELEILEEKKIPEKLDHLIGYDIQQFDDLKEYVEIATNDLFGKVNKIIDTLDSLIDYLKSKGE